MTNAKRAIRARPTFVRPNFERMPPELKQLKNWVLWGRGLERFKMDEAPHPSFRVWR